MKMKSLLGKIKIGKRIIDDGIWNYWRGSSYVVVHFSLTLENKGEVMDLFFYSIFFLLVVTCFNSNFKAY